MAKISVPIVIDGSDIVRSVVRRIMDEAEFKDGITDDYKNGFYDFGNAIIEALDKRDGVQAEPPKVGVSE